VGRRKRRRYDDTRESHGLLLAERVVRRSESGAESLGLCDGERTKDEIVQELKRRYPDADLEGDVQEFLKEALERQWLEPPPKT
jgi:pyrroloquinoline quinone biosynthesis protein D